MRYFSWMPVVAVIAAAASFSAQTADTPQRDVFFGETHLHTSWSLDAYALSNSIFNGPAEAYRYARGEAISHPGGYDIRITKPLDWIGVTEHAEYVGAFTLANEEGSILREKHPVVAESLKIGTGINALAAYVLLSKTLTNNSPIEALQDPEVTGSVWRRLVDIADDYYEPGKLTTFAAYEWTSTPRGSNMHRNVIFRDTKKVPTVPFSAMESSDPVDLWTWMDAQRELGNDVLAISHNGNLSNGLMYPTDEDMGGRPVDAAWAAQRMRNEPLSEVKQGKGQSETSPFLSPNDEFANFEVLIWQLLGQTGQPSQYNSYIRQAYRDGLSLQGSGGFNPYKFGMVGGADSHNGAAAYRQKNYFGMHGVNDATDEQRLSSEKHLNMDNRTISPAGLTAVWAEENTREAIFDAMRRKEVYATSGVRIKLRLFGGWNYSPKLLRDADWLGDAYARGVPMGGDLPTPDSEAPSFIVHALKDPDSGNLDRIQIVKGWSRHGQSFERVYDVAWSGEREPDQVSGKLPPVGNTVNIADATYTNDIGSVELQAVWSDPEFDPSLDAFYYARALEIPTPRWNLIQSRKRGQLPPDGFAMTVQERAWSTPIWYTPSAKAREKAGQGLTIAELESNGATRLFDADIRQLVVGKTVVVKNLATEQVFDVFYGRDGRRLIAPQTDGQRVAGEFGNVLHSIGVGAPATYEISNGQLVTSLGGTDFDISIYRQGDRYYAARSNEFGHANYEILEIQD